MKSRARQLSAFSLLVVVLMAVFVRLRLLSIPLERDEGEFAYMATQQQNDLAKHATAD